MAAIPLPPHLTEKWQGLVDLLAEILQVPAALVMRAEPPEMTVAVSSHSAGNPYPQGARCSLEPGLYCEAVLKNRQRLLVVDAREEAPWRSNPDLALGMVSYLGFPIAWPWGELFGTLCVLDVKANSFGELAQRLMLQFRDLIELDLRLQRDFQVGQTESRGKLVESERARRNLLNVLEEMQQTEESLRQSEERFRTLIEQAPEAIVVHDLAQGSFVIANRNAERLFGCSREELLQRGVEQFYAPVQPDGLPVAESIRLHIEQALVQEEVVCERVIRPAHGGEIYCEVHVVRLPSADRQLVRASYLDITARKRAEEALRLAEFSIEHSSLPTIWCDRSSQVLRVNQATCDVLGYPREELLRMKVGDFDPNYASQEAWDAAWEEIRTRRNYVVVETCHRRRDGTMVPVEVVCSYLEYAGKEYVFACIRDISQRKQGEEDLQRANERLQDIIEFLPDAIFVIDKDKKVIAWNRALELMTGVGKEEMLGQGDYAYAIPFWGQRQPIMIDLLDENPPEVRANYDFLECRSDRVWAETYAPLLNGGRGAYAWAIASPLFDKEGNRYGAIESVRDITERKQAEAELLRYRQHLEELVEERTAELAAANRALAERTEQLQALACQLTEAEQRERRRIAYVLHEDLQQLLVAARFSLGVLRDKGYRSAAAQALDSLDRAIAVSRSLTHELRPPVLHELGLAAALGWLARQARDKYNLTVEIVAEPEAEPASDSLRVLLFEAIHGLLLNVVKHAQINRAQVCLSRRGNQVQVVVADAGVGFDPAQDRGGFGLFSIRERIEPLGGRVEVDSAPGAGTRVCLTLPLPALPGRVSNGQTG